MERAARGPWELVEVCVLGGFVEGPVKLAHYNITQNQSRGLSCSPSAVARPHGTGWRVVWSRLRVLLSLSVSPNFARIVCLVICPIYFRFILCFFSFWAFLFVFCTVQACIEHPALLSKSLEQFLFKEADVAVKCE